MSYQSATPVLTESGYAEVNGTHLYYEMAGEGEPVVLLHGLGGDTRYWQGVFDTLAPQYQVVRYDMRGFGRSALPTTEPYTHADDLMALLGYLGIERAHLMGHSFGGNQAIQFALAHPAATRSLILISNGLQGVQGQPGATPAEDATWAVVFAALEEGDRQAAGAAVVDHHPFFRVARTMPAECAMLTAMLSDYSWWHFQGNQDPVVIPAIPAAARLGEISAPTLVITGELDVPNAHFISDLTAQGIRGAQRVVMAGLDHVPFLEDPVAFHQIALPFLAAH
ncbi:MAG: alpha/beta hydrolase [Caldilineaceae bacterium]